MLHFSSEQVIDVYRQLIPQLDSFLNQMPHEDLEALKANYTI